MAFSVRANMHMRIIKAVARKNVWGGGGGGGGQGVDPGFSEGEANDNVWPCSQMVLFPTPSDAGVS